MHCSRAVGGELTAGSALITGGLGGLGLLVAAWLAERGAKQLILLGRSGRAAPSAPLQALLTGALPPAESKAVASAPQSGAAAAIVKMLRCDVSDRDELAAALMGFRPAFVCHASGVLQAR